MTGTRQPKPFTTRSVFSVRLSARFAARMLFGALALVMAPHAGGAYQETPRGLRIIAVETEAAAAALRERVLAGDSFELLAREHSLDPTADQGGYLGHFRMEDLRAAFEEALRGVPPGEPSPVVRLDDAWVLLEQFSDREEDWTAITDQGIGAFRQGRFAEARRLFRMAVEVAEGFGPADHRLARSLTNLATVSFREGRPSTAEPLYRRSLAIQEQIFGPGHPALTQALTDLGVMLYSAGRDLGEAEALLGRALAIAEADSGAGSTETATALGYLGIVLRARGDFTGAAPLLERSLAIAEDLGGPDDPSVPLVLDELAELRRLQGTFPEAERLARRSLAISESLLGADHPELSGSLERLARLCLEQGRYAEAISLYGRSLANRWRSPSGNPAGEVGGVLDRWTGLLLAAVLGGPGFDHALQEFETTLEGGPFHEDLYVAMSNILLAQGLPREAERVMLRAVEAFPGSRQMRFELAETYVASQLHQKALDTFREIRTETDPGRSFVLVRIGDMRTSLLDDAGALAAFREALAADPESVEAWASLGHLHFELHEHREAIAAYSEALARDPGHTTALGRLAEIHLTLEEYEDARANALRALEIDPERAETRYVHAVALRNLGRDEEAGRAFAEYQRLRSVADAADQRDRELGRIDAVVSATLKREAYDEATEILRNAVAMYPDAYLQHLKLGRLLGQTGDSPAAIAVLEAGAALEGSADFRVRASLAREYAAIGDEEASLRNQALYLQGIGQRLRDEVR